MYSEWIWIVVGWYKLSSDIDNIIILFWNDEVGECLWLKNF